jgi:hypothetical protein
MKDALRFHVYRTYTGGRFQMNRGVLLRRGSKSLTRSSKKIEGFKRDPIHPVTIFNDFPTKPPQAPRSKILNIWLPGRPNNLVVVASDMDGSEGAGVSPSGGGWITGGLDAFDDIMNDTEGMSQPEAVPQPLSHPRDPAIGSGLSSSRHMQPAFQPGALSAGNKS